jgi:hypothetical protein
LGNQASKEAEAFRQATLEGKSISDSDFWDRVAWHKANPTTEALEQRRQDAYRGTFMRELPPSLKAFQNFVKKVPGLRWIFPFTHIPLDLMRATQEHSIAAPLDPSFRADLFGKNGGRAQDKALSRIVVGSAIMGYFVNEYMQGRATTTPTNHKEWQEYTLNHKIPNAIQIGDEWYSFDKFGPAGALAALGASIGHIITHSDKADPENWTKMVWMATDAAATAVADFPGFLTLQNFFRAKEDPKSATQFMAWQAGSLLPFSSLLSQTASYADPDMRRAKTFIDGLLYRLPGARETLAPKLDPLYGTPMENPSYGRIIRAVPVQHDPIKDELTRIGYIPTAPRDQIGGVKLTPEQYLKYQATAGPYVRAKLQEIMTNPMWQKYNDRPEWQKEWARSAVSFGRDKAARVIQADSLARDGPNNLVAQGKARRHKQINMPVQ